MARKNGALEEKRYCGEKLARRKREEKAFDT